MDYNRYKNVKDKQQAVSNQLDFLNEPKLLEDNDTLNKLFRKKSYTKEDIETCCQKLFIEFNLDKSQYFLLIHQFDKNIANRIVSSENPLFCVYDRNEENWATFCVIRSNDNKALNILHVDSKGRDIPVKYEEKILKRHDQGHFINHKINANHKASQFGAFCLRNLYCILSYYQTEPQKLADDFLNLPFCTTHDLDTLITSKTIKQTIKLSENTNFLNELNQFIDNLPIELGKKGLNYKTILNEELKCENEQEFNSDRVKAARAEIKKDEIEDVCKKFQDLSEDTKNNQMKIEQKYPKEMKSFMNIICTLESSDINESFFNALGQISSILNLSYDKLAVFYDITSAEAYELDDDKLTIKSLEEIDEQIQGMQRTNVTSAEVCTPFEQLLEEVILSIGDDYKNLLQSNFIKVKEEMKIWSEVDTSRIKAWAEEQKSSSSELNICESLAVINRGFYLLKNFCLRDTQILAILIYLLQSDKGILIEIKTGEGKTVIVATLAMIKTLQGHQVDVITSNPILAQEGAEESMDLFHLFNLTVATNNINNSSTNSANLGYKADVLYGTISNFQFDYLKDNFEGFSIRYERRFDCVILDEVDSMLVDNGGHIAKLATPFPGMDSLRYIYIKLWQELQAAEEEFQIEMTEKLKTKIMELGDDKSLSEWEEYVEELCKNERKYLANKIKAKNPLDSIPLIPTHLQAYAQSKLDQWIKNAIHAKYNCHEKQQYRIIEDGSTKEQVIVPVDYQNTGVTLKNTIWSNGLHQFVQLKHNLFLTFESLTSSFISNIGYIKNYSQANIYGMSGTLGSTAEQQFLASIYNVEFAKIPTYKPKIFSELPGIIFESDNWTNEITVTIVDYIHENRAVLTIFETVADLLEVATNLQIVQKVMPEVNMRVRIFSNEDHADETKEKVEIGDVILSTNIAGRGTNFKTTKDLEDNGGLHVCVGFLPCNKRVEDQAFGRTSRQGNRGTAQLVLRSNEVAELGLESENDFTKIKELRDNLEGKRISEINETLVKELDFKDAIFKLFTKKYRTFKEKNLDSGHYYIVQDLKEKWAFWLEKKNYKGKNLPKATPKEEFQDFMNEASEIFEGKITHNPYNCIQLANYYMSQDHFDEAKKTLEQAILLSGGDTLMGGVYFKLFEIAMSNNGIMQERLKKALASVIFINYTKNETYKENAKIYLDKTIKALNKELEYIEKNFLANENNELFDKIVIKVDSPFLKHIQGRYFLLILYKTNAENLLKDLDTDEGLLLDGTLIMDLKAVKSFSENNDNDDIKIDYSANVTFDEIEELKALGFESTYSVKVVHDIEPRIIHWAVGEIAAGIAILGVGLCFLPVFPFCAALAGSLISDALFEIVSNLLSKGDEEFDVKGFFKSKFSSYAISILTAGVAAVKQCVKILKIATKFIQKLSTVLKKSKYLRRICVWIARKLDKVIKRLEDAIKAVRSVSRFQMVKEFSKTCGTRFLDKCSDSIVSKYVLQPLYAQSIGKLVQLIADELSKAVKKKIQSSATLCEKLAINKQDDVLEIVDIYLEDSLSFEKNTVFQALDSVFEKKNFVKILKYASGITSEVIDVIYMICSRYIDYLNENLTMEGNSKNNVDDLSSKVADRVAEKFVNNMYTFLKDGAQDGAASLYEKKGKKIENYIKSSIKSKMASGQETEVKALLNAYNNMEFDKSASDKDVKRAYTMMALQYHPDKNLDNREFAEEKFKEITDEYKEICKRRDTI